jgi:Flp pilus assembly protein TadG
MCTGNRERGASAVEFALVLPVLMLILFGIIEFGFIMYDKALITNASREGARRGIVYSENTAGIPVAVPASDITNIVSSYCASYLVSLGTGTATPSTTVTGNCAVPGNSLTVAVSYPYTFLVLPDLGRSYGGSLSGGITLSGTTVMRCENQ